MCCVVFFKQKPAYEMRISDWSSDVCSSDLHLLARRDDDVIFGGVVARIRLAAETHEPVGLDRKSVVSGKSVSVRVDLGGRRIIKTKKQNKICNNYYTAHHSSQQPT